MAVSGALMGRVDMHTETQANSVRCLYLERNQILAGGPDSPVGCIASKCGWWRGGESACVESMTLEHDDYPGETASQEDAREHGWVDSYSEAKGRREWSKYEERGYCGKAGEPK